jgi:hypothetical protein
MNKKKQKRNEKSYMNDLWSVPPELQGGLIAIPFGHNNSGPRNTMGLKSVIQTWIPVKADFPLVYTGFEHKVKEYMFEEMSVNEDIEIIKVIPKYETNFKDLNIKESPSYTIIFRRLDSNVIDYIEYNRYTECVDGYGCRNLLNFPLEENTIIRKNSKIFNPHSIQNEKYCYGINANVLYMSILDVTEDTAVVSEDFAKKITPINVGTKMIKFDPRDYPANKYGDDIYWKILPDIGEKVKDDGILCSIKKFNKVGAISDFNKEALKKSNHIHDKNIIIEKDSTIIDIDVFLSNKYPYPDIYQQIFSYNDNKMLYYKKLNEFYESHYRHNEMSEKFVTLVTEAKSRLYAFGLLWRDNKNKRRNKVRLTQKNKEVKLTVIVKYMKYENILDAYKVTNRHGNKGVITIWKTEDMPIDNYGVRADIIMCPFSPEARTNIGQLYEQGINKVSFHVLLENQKIEDINMKFQHIINYITKINKDYAALIENIVKSENDKLNYIKYIYKNGIHLNISQQNNINPKLMLSLQKDYNVQATKLTYYKRDKYGRRIKKVTKTPMIIGKQYMLLLYNKADLSGASTMNTNSMGINVKPNKQLMDVSYIKPQGPKIGEDESRCLINNNPLKLDNDTTGLSARLKLLQNASPLGKRKVIEAILTASNPMDVKIPVSSDKLKSNNIPENVIQNLLTIQGINMSKEDVRISDKDLIYYKKLLELGESNDE